MNRIQSGNGTGLALEKTWGHFSPKESVFKETQMVFKKSLALGLGQGVWCDSVGGGAVWKEGVCLHGDLEKRGEVQGEMTQGFKAR